MFRCNEIYKITANFPSQEKFSLVDQMRRSSVSVPSNIVEGYQKSSKEFSRYLGIAKGSLEELKYYLYLSSDLKFITREQYNELLRDADEIGKMIYTLKTKLHF